MRQNNVLGLDQTTAIFAGALALLLVMRVGGLLLSPLDLGPDEAQYWRWAQSFDWGYFSKPPMIAWVIAASTSVFGDSEWAVRLPAPLLHTFAAAALYHLGRSMYGAKAGLLAGLVYALMPGVVLSSAVMSTDGVLLPFWSIALVMLWRLREGTGGWLTAVTLGTAIGIGFLSKYAMVYVLIGLALVSLIDPQSRRALLSLKGLAALTLAAAIFAPHMLWNAANDFKTVSHTVDNANLGGPLFNPGHAVKFFTDQMGVFGPIAFLSLIGGAVILKRDAAAEIMGRDRWLLCFIVPVLIIILFQAVLSRAHANWAATAYPAASVLIAGWFTRTRLASVLWSSIGLHAFVATVFTVIAIGPVSWSESIGAANAFKRARGWDATTQAIADKARAVDATAILVDERENWHGLDYYGRDGLPAPVIGWRRYGGVKSYSEEAPLTDAIDDRVLVASIRAGFRPRMRADFETFEEAGSIEIPLGGGKVRRFKLYLASGFDPLPRGADWEARFAGQEER